MKKLIPNPDLTAEVWVPEDGIDHRTAASLEPAFQALLDRVEYMRRIPPRIRPFTNQDTYPEYSTSKKVTNNNTYLWLAQITYMPYLQRIDLNTMKRTVFSITGNDSYVTALRVSPTTGTLIAAHSSDGTNSTIYRSTDNGNTWVSVLTASGASNPYIAWSPTAVILGQGTKVWISTNDGQTWTAYTTNIDTGIWDDAIWFIDRWWIKATISGTPTILWSTNGVTWNTATGPWSKVIGQKFWGYSGLLYLPVRPITTWDGTALTSLGIDNVSVIGVLGGRLVYWTTDSANPLMVDLELGSGVFFPKPTVFSDSLVLWNDGLA